MDVGQNIRAVREQHGLTREAFAEKIGISASFVYDLEHGKSGPSVDTLVTISQTLNVSVDTLLFGPDKKEKFSDILCLLDGFNSEQLSMIENIIREIKTGMNI